MDVADLAAQLAPYGLDEAEAHLYYHLSRLGPARAAAVAQAAGRKRTDTYRVLDSLVDKGFAQKSLDRPARFIPMPPEEALGRALAARRSQLEALDGQRAALAAAWPRPRAGGEPSRQRFAIHQGRAQINGLLARMIDGAAEEVALATSSDGLARLDTAALRARLEAKARTGALVRVLARRGAGELPLTDLQGAQVRYTELPTFYQALLVDAREAALFVNSGKGISGSEETVLWLNSSDIVLAQKALFDQGWAQAPARADLEGGAPRNLEVVRGRWVRGARLRQMVAGARTSIAIQAPASEAARWPKQGIVQALAKRAAAGVAVSLHVPGGSVHVPGALVTDAGACTGLLAVVDGESVLLAPGLEGGSGGTSASSEHEEEEWAIWSTRPGMAELVRMLGLAGPAVLPDK